MVFILLYLWTSSSLEGILCCPFPIPVTEKQASSFTPSFIKYLLVPTMCQALELETLGDIAVNKANSISALTEFSLMEITGKEQIIMTQHGRGYDGDDTEY